MSRDEEGGVCGEEGEEEEEEEEEDAEELTANVDSANAKVTFACT